MPMVKCDEVRRITGALPQHIVTIEIFQISLNDSLAAMQVNQLARLSPHICGISPPQDTEIIS